MMLSGKPTITKNKHPKGLGILSFNGAQISPLEFDEDMELYIPVNVVFKNISFNLLAVWNFYYACKQGRFKGVKGENCLEWSAIRHYTNTLDYPLLIGEIGTLDQHFLPNHLLICAIDFEQIRLKVYIIILII